MRTVDLRFGRWVEPCTRRAATRHSAQIPKWFGHQGKDRLPEFPQELHRWLIPLEQRFTANTRTQTEKSKQ